MALLVEIVVNGTTRRIAYGARALDTYQWRPYLLGFDPIRFSMKTKYGGYVAVEFGQMKLSPTLFADSADWPPPVSCAVTAKFLDINASTDDSSAVTVFVGTAHLVGAKRDMITYRLYGPEYDVDLLATTTDYNGDTVSLPRAFGDVTHVNLVRLADVGGKPTYHKGYVAGVKGADWHIFDDGVDIDANATDNGDGTFSLNVALVGELTLSGTGADTTLTEVCDWACGASYLNLTYDDDEAAGSQPDLAYWADSQMTMTDFLSKICAFFSHIFYIDSGTLYLVGMGEDNGSRSINDYDFFKSGSYYYEDPVSLLTSTWQTRAAVEETIGKYIKTYDHETYHASSYPYGADISITPYHDTKSNIDTALSDIEDTLHAAWVQISIPLDDDLPDPGEKITVTDTVLVNDLTAVFRVREMTFDFDTKKVVVAGEGSIS